MWEFFCLTDLHTLIHKIWEITKVLLYLPWHTEEYPGSPGVSSSGSFQVLAHPWGISSSPLSLYLFQKKNNKNIYFKTLDCFANSTNRVKGHLNMWGFLAPSSSMLMMIGFTLYGCHRMQGRSRGLLEGLYSVLSCIYVGGNEIALIPLPSWLHSYFSLNLSLHNSNLGEGQSSNPAPIGNDWKVQSGVHLT